MKWQPTELIGKWNRNKLPVFIYHKLQQPVEVCHWFLLFSSLHLPTNSFTFYISSINRFHLCWLLCSLKWDSFVQTNHKLNRHHATSIHVGQRNENMCHCTVLHGLTEKIPCCKLVEKGPRAERETEPQGSVSLCEVEMDPCPAVLCHAVNFPVRITEARHKPVWESAS